jgi:hypothetical protein
MNTDNHLQDWLTELGEQATGPTAMPPELGSRIAQRRRRFAIAGASGAVLTLAGGAALATQLTLGSGSSPSRTVVMPQSDASTPPAEQSPTSTPTPAVIGGVHATDCPSALPLGNDINEALGAVLADPWELYPDIDTKGATGTAKIASEDASGYGGIAIQACGEAVADRTVVVTLHFPAMDPSASLSTGVVFVSRDDSGWLVWRVVR